VASGWTNKGKFRALGILFRNDTEPTTFFIALLTAATSPTPDTNIMSDHTQIAAGNGYSDGGISIARNATDFDVHTEDDANDRSLIQLKDEVWTASGGSIPASGGGARWAVVTDDNGTVGSREIYAYFDLVSDRTVSASQTLTLQNCEMRLTE
jgi:hypothetical protein